MPFEFSRLRLIGDVDHKHSFLSVRGTECIVDDCREFLFNIYRLPTGNTAGFCLETQFVRLADRKLFSVYRKYLLDVGQVII